MKEGTRGMGSHKHGVSGRAPHNKSNAIQRAREVNAEMKRAQELKKKRAGKMFSSVSQVFGR